MKVRITAPIKDLEKLGYHIYPNRNDQEGRIYLDLTSKAESELIELLKKWSN